MESTPFPVHLALKGRTVATLSDVTTHTSCADLYKQAVAALGDEGAAVKLLYKGKRLDPTDVKPVFASAPKKTPKILVLATATGEISELKSKRSDPTIRGFDQEIVKPLRDSESPWGALGHQDQNYKFCRFEACTWQSFGHRPTENQTPHAFAAMQLLEKLATDPGIVAIMKERELVVGTLGEMDPIDDRLMQKKQQQGACLLGYNTNGGLRIDVKLRNDDLIGFRPYPQLVATLIHELSHNWVGEHNLLFWTNFGQMRAEYLCTHARLRSNVINGKTSAELAGLRGFDSHGVYNFVMKELQQDMAQHGLDPNMVAEPIRERCQQLEDEKELTSGNKLGNESSASRSTNRSARDLALEAAERRARQQKKDGDSRGL